MSILDQILLIPGIGRRSRKILLPEDFDNWDLPVNIFRTGLRSYRIDKTVDDFMPLTDQVLYVDSVNGNNSHSGLAPEFAKQSIGSAITAATGVPRVLISPGNYSPSGVTKTCILEGNGGNFQLDQIRAVSTSGITVGFRNFTANFRLTITGASTFVFDSPTLSAASSSSIRGEGASKIITYNATEINCVNDALSYTNTCMALEVDCIFDTLGTNAADNCSTGHQDSRIVSVNCQYRNAFRTVHDINNSKRLMFGGEVKQSQGTLTEGNSFCVGMGFSSLPGSGIIWLYGVDTDDTGMDNAALHSLFVGSSDGTSSIYYDNETLFKSIGGTGTVELFEKQYAS